MILEYIHVILALNILFAVGSDAINQRMQLQSFLPSNDTTETIEKYENLYKPQVNLFIFILTNSYIKFL